VKTVNLARFFWVIMVAAVFSKVSGAQTPADNQSTQWVYFGTYTGKHSRGIYVAQFNPATGKLTAAELAAETKNPTFLALDPQRQFLYAVNEVGDFGGGNSGAVSSFKLDRKTGVLTFLNQKPSGGSGPCHLAVAENGKCLLVANYGSGSTAVLPIGSDGRLSDPSDSVQHHGSSVNHQRQEGPHAHFVTWDPSQRFALTCDLGLDKVLCYRLNPSLSALSAGDPPFSSLKPGSGPRHLAFSPNGRFAYVLNELASTLTCCVYDASTGELKEIQTLSTLPETFHGQNTCAEIQIHPSGRFLYASNRGHDSIAVFALDSNSGKATNTQYEPTQGKTPRHFSLDPSGRWLIAENQDSDSVVVFAVDSQTGKLSPTGTSQTVGAPVCLVFIPKL
jgi:6-phosphogluconolactonase